MKKGFTLIELLIVIAIIGILASVVLVAFPGATKKAKDSRIVSAISQARTVMVYVYGNDGHYDNFSTSLPADEMPALTTEVSDNDGTLVIVTYDSDGDGDTDAACMYSTLNAGGYYCADSTGRAGEVTDPTGTCGGISNDGSCGF